jgi:hypothetical protein
MDVGVVGRVRPAEQVGVPRAPSDVAPALGVEGPGRMEEDSYGESKQQDRGMEEEADILDENADESESHPGLGKKRGVNVFA